MAGYHYDESGNMAAYFIITFLAFVLIPTTLSGGSQARTHRSYLRPLTSLILHRTEKTINSENTCQCEPCIEQRQKVSRREKGSVFNPRFSLRYVTLNTLGPTWQLK